MPKIIIGKSKNHSVGFDLNTLIRTRLLIQANSGGGKSWLIRLLAEQAFGKIQVIILDWEGEFASLRESFGFLLVGKSGETPTDIRSAALLAHKLLELNASAVCDLSEAKAHERHEWVKRFLEALVDSPKSLWHPVMVIVDEAHIFCPEKGAGESVASDAMIGLATRGRKRGFCAVFATQRLGKLRKDAAAELLNILVGMTFIDIDRKRAADSFGITRDKASFAPFSKELMTMNPGNFFALGRAISKERILVSIGKVQTTHPEPGSKKFAAAPPPAPDKIKALLPKLKDLPQAAEDRAKTEAEYKKQIRSLEIQLRTKPKEVIVDRQADRREIEKALTSQRKEFEKIIELSKKANTETLQVFREIERHSTTIAKLSHHATTIHGVPIKLPPYQLPIEEKSKTKEIPRVLPSSREGRTISTSPRPETNGDVKTTTNLRAGALRMLKAAATFYPEGVNESQIAAQSGISRRGGSFGSYASMLKTAGYITIRNGKHFATDAGIDLIGGKPESPQTTQEVLALWTPKFRAGINRMLQIIIKLGGDNISYEDLSAQAQVSGGSFHSYLSALKTADLIIAENKTVRANKETLFL